MPPTFTPTEAIHGYHAHVYFNAESQAAAQTLCEGAAAVFPLKMGRIHERPVGPHPDWSCQLAFKATLFGEVIPCLALNPSLATTSSTTATVRSGWGLCGRWTSVCCPSRRQPTNSESLRR